MSLQVSDTVSIQMYRAACQKKHVRRIPELRQNAGLTTPLLAGLLHTKLYLPATGYSAEERKLIFTMNSHIIAIGISGIRCSFESVHRYTGSIPFFLSC